MPASGGACLYPSTQEAEKDGSLYEFGASLAHRVSSRTAKTCYTEMPCLREKNKIKDYIYVCMYKIDILYYIYYRKIEFPRAMY